MFRCHTDILYRLWASHTRWYSRWQQQIIASHQDIPKLPCTQIVQLSGYSVRWLTRNRSSSVAVSNVCSSKQHISDSPKSPQVHAISPDGATSSHIQMFLPRDTTKWASLLSSVVPLRTSDLPITHPAHRCTEALVDMPLSHAVDCLQ